MDQKSPFDNHVSIYEQWFDNNPAVYRAELGAIKELLPGDQSEVVGVEVGGGSGRFAAPLGIELGIEPSVQMGAVATGRGITVIRGVAEKLPLAAETADYVLMVTTICFVDDLFTAFTEIRRILRAQGKMIIGFVDADGPLSELYQAKKQKSVFYRDAVFYSVADVVELLQQAGFHSFSFRQTLFHELSEIADDEPIIEGHGQGGFVVICASK